MNSRAKGARGEREFRDLLREQGFLKAHRGQQFCGLSGNADVVCPELPTIHFEVKRTERGNPYDWMAQARRDCGGVPCKDGKGHPGMKIPVVAHKRNSSEWLVVMSASDFFTLVRRSDLASEGSNGSDSNP